MSRAFVVLAQILVAAATVPKVQFSWNDVSPEWMADAGLLHEDPEGNRTVSPFDSAFAKKAARAYWGDDLIASGANGLAKCLHRERLGGPQVVVDPVPVRPLSP